MTKLKMLGSGEHSRCVASDWLNLQTACLIAMCVTSVLAATAIIIVTVTCDGQLNVTWVNGTMTCGKNSVEIIQPGINEQKTQGGSYFRNDEERILEQEHHKLGSVMRIILVLVVVIIIIIIAVISMHKVVLRERHRRLSGELEKLMEKNGVNANCVKGASLQSLPLHPDDYVV